MGAPSADLPVGLAGLRYPITQISLAVRDMDALLERYYHAFGWAPWQVFHHKLPLHHSTDLRGESVHYAMYGAEVYVGLVGSVVAAFYGLNAVGKHLAARNHVRPRAGKGGSK